MKANGSIRESGLSPRMILELPTKQCYASAIPLGDEKRRVSHATSHRLASICVDGKMECHSCQRFPPGFNQAAG